MTARVISEIYFKQISQKVSSGGENLKSKSGQIHGNKRVELKSILNQVIKFAGVPIFQKAEGTLPRRRLGYEVNFF